MPIPETADAAPVRKRFTREEVDRLDETGIFAGQRYELIDGDLIDKMGQKPPHAFTIQLIFGRLAGLFDVILVRVQHPMEAAPGDRERSLPESDVAVLREHNVEHLSRHPRGDEMLLVIEVSDTTAAFDRSRKATLYARAGVPEYWVLDLNRRMLVVHRETDGAQYRQTFLHGPDEAVSILGRSEASASPTSCLRRRPASRLPLDRFKQTAEPLAFQPVDHLNEADATFEMRSKIGELGAILRFGTRADAVRKYGLE
jgi:Uma2 family endonuclease